MANRFYGLDRGQTEFSVNEAAATASKDVEVNVDLAAGLEKSEVLLALEMIMAHITKGNWPPA